MAKINVREFHNYVVGNDKKSPIDERLNLSTPREIRDNNLNEFKQQEENRRNNDELFSIDHAKWLHNGRLKIYGK